MRFSAFWLTCLGRLTRCACKLNEERVPWSLKLSTHPHRDQPIEGQQCKMARKSIQNIIILLLTLSIAVVAAGCTIGAGNDPPHVQGTPTVGSTNTLPATPVAILDTPVPGTGNSLAISEPA